MVSMVLLKSVLEVKIYGFCSSYKKEKKKKKEDEVQTLYFVEEGSEKGF